MFCLRFPWKLLGVNIGIFYVFLPYFIPVVICVVTVLSACLGQFLGEAMTLASLIKEGELAISYADIPYSIIYLLSNNSEYLSIVVKNLALGIMFALLGVWGILRASRKEHKDAALNAIVLE